MRTHYIIILSLMLVACSGNEKKAQEEQTHEILVSTITVNNTSSGVTRNYVGIVEEDYAATLSFAEPGYVERIFANEGNLVKDGQVLGQLDKRKAQSLYNAAKSKLAQAEDAYERLKQVYEEGGLAEVKWIEMQTNLTTAQSMEQIAKKSLEDTELLAPFTGVVGELMIEEGMNALPMQPVIKILEISNVYIRFSIPENEIATTNKGLKAVVEVPALNNLIFEGEITERGVVANKLSHSYEAKIKLPNTEHKLLPGMVCKVQIAPNDTTNGYIIPAQAVQVGLDDTYVWVVTDGKTYRKKIEVSSYISDGVLVESGLNQSDIVVTEGIQKIYEGAKVTLQ